MPDTPELETGSPSLAADAAGRPVPFTNPHKRRTGFERMVHATRHSLDGLRAGWQERAFRLETGCAIVLLPAALWLGRGWVESVLLAGTVLIVLVVELLNTAIESAVDRFGPEWHALSKRAKDLGSAAVMVSLLLCGGTWGLALLARLGG